jgi:hypothetical protein
MIFQLIKLLRDMRVCLNMINNNLLSSINDAMATIMIKDLSILKRTSKTRR